MPDIVDNTENVKTDPVVIDKVEPEKTDPVVVPEPVKQPIAQPKMYNEDEVNKLINEKVQEVQKTAYKTAKDQLNAELTTLKDKIAKMEKTTPDPATKEELEALQNKLSDTTKKLTVMENEGAKAIVAVAELEKKLQQSALAQKRAEVIAEAKGEIIPEMVVGNTEEEILAAAKKAQEQYYEIDKAIREKLNLPTRAEEEKHNASSAKPVEITRIDIRDRNQVKNWEETRKEALNKIYADYGIVNN